MSLNRFGLIKTLTVAALSLAGSIQSAEAASTRLIGLTNDNTLLSFDLDDPSETQTIEVTGVNGTLLGIDLRPANGLLYGVSDTDDVYTIDPMSGVATFQSTLDTSYMGGGVLSGFDFNPAADRLRLEGVDDQNFRINVDTGEVIVDGDLVYVDDNAGISPTVTAAGYINSFLGAPAGRSTALYTIDSNLDTFNLQVSANDGTLAVVGPLGFDVPDVAGFDIFSPTEGANIAYAAFNSTLYTIDIETGAATELGSIGGDSENIIGLTATTVPESGTVVSLLGLGAGLGLLKLRNQFRNS